MQNTYPSRNYIELKTIYHNSHSRISLVKAQNGCIYIRKDVYLKVFYHNPYFKSYFETEKRIMSLQGQFIVSMYDQWKENNYYTIIMENCDLGDLRQHVKTKYDDKIPHQIIPEIFAQVLCGIGEIHKYNIIHRDLKPQNIFLKSQNEQIVVKLGDFGTSTIQKQQLNKTQLGTKGYMAPQIFENKAYSSKVDVWSLGVVLYKLYNQMRQPFAKYDNDQIVSEAEQQYYKRIKNTKIKSPIFRIPKKYQENKLTKLAKKLVKRMLEYNPEKRIDWHDIVKSPYMIEFKQQALKIQKYRKILKKLFKIEEFYQQRKKKMKMIQIQSININMLKDEILKPIEKLLKIDKRHPHMCELLFLLYLGVRRILLILCESKEVRIQLGIYTSQKYYEELQLIQWKEDILYQISFEYLETKKTVFQITAQYLYIYYFMNLLNESKNYLKLYQCQSSQTIIWTIEQYLRLQVYQDNRKTVVLDSDLFQSLLIKN